MATEAIRCGACQWPVPVEAWNREGFACAMCGERVEALVFPAIERRRAGTLPEAVLADTEAACFYHPSSRAVVPCDECGRFLCNLCDLEIGGRHLCSRCFESGVESNRLEAVETRRTMYDSIALALATFPAMLFWPALIAAPAALYIVIRRWRAPGSIVPRTRVRYYLAALLAIVEILGLGALIAAAIWGLTAGSRGARRA